MHHLVRINKHLVRINKQTRLSVRINYCFYQKLISNYILAVFLFEKRFNFS